jgi:thiol-disulfide isomerase/thioredoxin
MLFLILSFAAVANDSAYVRFVFSAPLNAQNFFITLHDGISEHKIDAQNVRYWQGELFSPFGHITIRYNNSDTTSIIKEAFFKKGDVKVYLTQLPDANEYYAIDERSSINVISYTKMGGAALDTFVKDEVNARNDFIRENKSKFGTDNAVLQNAFSLANAVIYKKLEFIRQFPTLYISFWTFLNEIVKANLVSPDTLMAFYNSVLPDKYKSSASAKHLARALQNKIAVTTENNFPNFSATDINNNKIELSKLRGKYVLIQIWASWCGPCVKEIPDLKSIYDKYEGPEFMLISLSRDKDETAFRTAVEKYAMNWTQIFGADRLCNALAQFAVPQLYLIDKTGRTIYNYNVEDDIGLTLLKKKLREHLGNQVP